MIIPPHCPDDGISLGCVEFLRRKYKQPSFEKKNFPFWQSDEDGGVPNDVTIDRAAELLAQGKIVGWYQGNGEIGPRALGNRSILMDPTIKRGKDVINNKVKHREPYRPFGASILLGDVSRVFQWHDESPYMLYNAKCREPKRYSSIVHVDGSCRIQTVNQEHEHFYRLIDSFKRKTGIPTVLNTSLNIDGKPIAAYKQDAKTLFEKTEMDAVIIGNDILTK
jgi:carbamoyltransferase